MLNIRTIALDITNLSDARYFSAYGVNWMAFPSSRQMDNISAIKEIIDWVEGPECAVQVEEEDQDFLEFFVKEVEVSGIVGPEDAITSNISLQRILSYESEAAILENMENGDLAIVPPSVLPSIPQEHYGQVFLDTQKIAAENVPDLVQKYRGIGIALYGSYEEKVGLKNFEAQNELIDVLLDLDV